LLNSRKNENVGGVKQSSFFCITNLPAERYIGLKFFLTNKVLGPLLVIHMRPWPGEYEFNIFSPVNNPEDCLEKDEGALEMAQGAEMKNAEPCPRPRIPPIRFDI